VADFVIREWRLAAYAGDQAPLHVHHRGDEAFCVLEGELEVRDGDERHRLTAGQFHVVRAGSVHTFATVGQADVRVLCVMTPEIDRLIQALHAQGTDMASVWRDHHSSLA
jgi:mannose-6-phosphate isomerase-like protein (cupin superfamily)